MIYDITNLFSEAQAVTATAPSTNVIDLGATGTPYDGNPLVRDIGKGKKVPVSVSVVEAFNNLTSLQVTVEVATDEVFTTPVEVASRTYLLADLAGGQLEFPDCIPEGADLRYMRLNYTVVGTAPTTGQLTAGIVAARQSNFGGY